jgi:ATP-dependent RNA helicase SUPV3L1/SUV3
MDPNSNYYNNNNSNNIRRNNNNNGNNLSFMLQGNFYDDSIPSFTDVLKQGPPESMNAALDVLVETGGLAERDVAAHYRTTHRLRLRQKELLPAVTELQQLLDYHQGLYDRQAMDVADAQERLAALPQQPPSETVATSATTANENNDNSNKDTSSLWNRTVQTVTSFFQPETQHPKTVLPETKPAMIAPQIDNAAIQKQRVNLLKILDEKRHNMKRHQANVDSISVKLQMLRHEQSERPPLSDEQYTRIQTAAAQAMPAITQAFAEHVRHRHSQMLQQYQALDAKTDLTRPHDWFLHARLDRRKIWFHGGPTNSGKTYAALERLRTAKRGMYLGPLRLLAAEVYEKLTADGMYCSLFTGQERREVPFATHGAATVEMALTTEEYDVIVVDEIQMISDWERGFAWTRALLGSRCKEIHVCGGMEAVEVVKRIADACGDEFELKTYERFSELHIAKSSLASMPDEMGSYKHVRAGDCVVAFSRNDIFAIKREIESTTEHKCCVIYGSLPPATRSEQARRFNNPGSGYDVLVASDAIGMGLNLNIRRIVFNSIYKNDGTGIVRLDHSAMKQISGRAGRRNSPFPIGGKSRMVVVKVSVGVTSAQTLSFMHRTEVTTRDPRDLQYLRHCMTTDVEPIRKAGLLPTASHIQTFSDALEQYGLGHGPKNLHKVLQQFNDMASVKSDYFVCKQGQMVQIARTIAGLDLSIVSLT